MVLIFKPEWVSHGKKPIYSVDIHPDGSRFATGGFDAKVKIWSMAPVRSEEAEKQNAKTLLTVLTNHTLAVNCVRFSPNGQYLASAGVDEAVMIWSLSGGKSFNRIGSDSANLENWTLKYVLKGHDKDVTNLAWSGGDKWLASSGVDNSVIIWSTTTFEKVARLLGHSAFVSGLCWDPLSRFLASQGDDKQLIVWNTEDWSAETTVTAPFENSGGTVLFRRPSWSPSGDVIAAAHAYNGPTPVCSFVARDEWTTNDNAVGHQAPVVATRFHSAIFRQPNVSGKRGSKKQAVLETCLAMGGQDLSVSIWLTQHKKPLIVVNDLFTESVFDISWSTLTTELIACSQDGTVAFIQLSPSETGTPLTEDEKQDSLMRVYGTHAGSGTASNSLAARLPENPIQLAQDKKMRQRNAQLKAAAAAATPAAVEMQVIFEPLNPDELMKTQRESRTNDGKRRIAPTMLVGRAVPAAQPTPAPPPVSASAPVSSSIPASMPAQQTPVALLERASAPTFTPSIHDADSLETQSTAFLASQPPDLSQFNGDSQQSSSVFAAADSRVGLLESRFNAAGGAPQVSTSFNSTLNKPATMSKHVSAPPATAGNKRKASESLPAPVRPGPGPVTSRHHPTINAGAASVPSVVAMTSGNAKKNKDLCFEVKGAEGELSTLVKVVNHSQMHPSASVIATSGSKVRWQAHLDSEITDMKASDNGKFMALSGANGALTILRMNGRRWLPPFQLNGRVIELVADQDNVAVIYFHGKEHFCSLWNVVSGSAVLQDVMVSPLTADAGGVLSYFCLMGAGTIPTVFLKSGLVYAYVDHLKAWILAGNSSIPRLILSGITTTPFPTLILTQIQKMAYLHNLATVDEDPSAYLDVNQAYASRIASFIDTQMAAALALKSDMEYLYWLKNYALCAASLGDMFHGDIHSLLEELFGAPGHLEDFDESTGAARVHNHTVLREFLDLLGSNPLNRKWQREIDSFNDQLNRIADGDFDLYIE